MNVQELIQELEQYDGDKEVKYNRGGVAEVARHVQLVDREHLDEEYISIE